LSLAVGAWLKYRPPRKAEMTSWRRTDASRNGITSKPRTRGEGTEASDRLADGRACLKTDAINRVALDLLAFCRDRLNRYRYGIASEIQPQNISYVKWGISHHVKSVGYDTSSVTTAQQTAADQRRLPRLILPDSSERSFASFGAIIG
jgi:hypothetical protein